MEHKTPRKITLTRADVVALIIAILLTGVIVGTVLKGKFDFFAMAAFFMIYGFVKYLILRLTKSDK